MTDTRTITERLDSLGYGHAADDLTKTDGRHAIYAHGMEGYTIGRLNAKEAAEFCNKLGG